MASPPGKEGGRARRLQAGWETGAAQLVSTLTRAEEELATRALAAATKTWSTLSGNGPAALAAGGELTRLVETVTGACDLHLQEACAALVELHPVPHTLVKKDWLKSPLGALRAAASLSPSRAPAQPG